MSLSSQKQCQLLKLLLKLKSLPTLHTGNNTVTDSLVLNKAFFISSIEKLYLLKNFIPKLLSCLIKTHWRFDRFCWRTRGQGLHAFLRIQNSVRANRILCLLSPNLNIFFSLKRWVTSQQRALQKIYINYPILVGHFKKVSEDTEFFTVATRNEAEELEVAFKCKNTLALIVFNLV